MSPNAPADTGAHPVTLELVCREFHLEHHVVRQWITRRWLRPDVVGDDDYAFHPIDRARVGLLVQLRDMELGDHAMPVVLSLVDQLYDARRTLGQLHAALAEAPDPVRSFFESWRDRR